MFRTFDAIVGDGAGLDLIEPVDEAGNSGFACAGGADKGDLLAGLCEEGDVVEDDLPVIVTKHHMVEPHIPPQGHQTAVRLFPRPRAGVIIRLSEGAVRFSFTRSSVTLPSSTSGSASMISKTRSAPATAERMVFTC